jgi:hypothetical protein
MARLTEFHRQQWLRPPDTSMRGTMAALGVRARREQGWRRERAYLPCGAQLHRPRLHLGVHTGADIGRG